MLTAVWGILQPRTSVQGSKALKVLANVTSIQSKETIKQSDVTIDVSLSRKYLQSLPTVVGLVPILRIVK